MTRPATPTSEKLLDWLEGRLSREESEAIALQVAVASEDIQMEVAWLRAFLKLADTIIWEAPLPTVHAALRQHFADNVKPAQPTAVQSDARVGLLQRIVAALSFDSHLRFEAAGARGAEQQPTRQLIYESTTADIALNFHLDTVDTLTLMGQILPIGDSSPTAYAVQMLQAERETAIVMADELGEFIFTGLQPGAYQLVVSTEQFDLTIPDLVLDL
ncbi:MAG: hypothetical protein R3C14_07470 [Caldilineaceae bacterium]